MASQSDTVQGFPTKTLLFPKNKRLVCVYIVGNFLLIPQNCPGPDSSCLCSCCCCQNPAVLENILFNQLSFLDGKKLSSKMLLLLFWTGIHSSTQLCCFRSNFYSRGFLWNPHPGLMPRDFNWGKQQHKSERDCYEYFETFKLPLRNHILQTQSYYRHQGGQLTKKKAVLKFWHFFFGFLRISSADDMSASFTETGNF